MGSPERMGAFPQGLVHLVAKSGFKPRSRHSPSNALPRLCCHGRSHRSGSQRSLHGQFHFQKDQLLRLHGWGEGQSSRNRNGQIPGKGGFGLCPSSWKLLDSPAPGRTPRKPSSWDRKGAKLGVECPQGHKYKKEELCMSAQHHTPRALLSCSHVLIRSMLPEPCEAGFHDCFIPMGKLRLRAGQGMPKITQLRKMELGVPFGSVGPFYRAQNLLSLTPNSGMRMELGEGQTCISSAVFCCGTGL